MYSQQLRKRIEGICLQQRRDQERINKGFPVRSRRTHREWLIRL